MKASDWVRGHWTLIALASLLLIGLVVRLVVVNIPGHYGDIHVTARWAEHMAQYGPWDFYKHDGAVYPALLYFYWPLGILLDGDGLLRAVKGLSIPFDLALGVVLYLVARRLTTPRRALLAPAIYLLNPAVLLAGPIWGQVDAAGALAYVGALWAVSSARYSAAGALAVVAALMKPQFGLVALPVAVVAILATRSGRSLRPIEGGLLGAMVAYVVIGLPLRLMPGLYLQLVQDAGARQPYTSLNALNPWAMLVGIKVPDDGLFLVGAALLVVGLALSLLPLLWRRDLATVLAVGLFVAFAFYFLPTRVHERYLFPVMVVLAPLAAASWRVLGTYVLLTIAFALTIIYGLVTTTSFKIPADWERLLVQHTAVVGIGLTILGVAATLIVLLLQRPLRTETQKT